MPAVPRHFPMTTPASTSYRFLLVDENLDGLFLLNKALLRTFPRAVMIECESAASAFAVLRKEKIAAVISHRTHEFDGASLVREMRKIHRTVPIIMTSGFDREKLALEAGATRFFNYDQWLTIGPFVAELLGATPAPTEAGAAASR